MALLQLSLIILLAWFLMLLGIGVIFALIVPLPEFLPGPLGAFITGVLKNLLALLLTILWLYAIVFLRNRYLKWAQGRREA